jgi:hypothetical protein
MSILARLSSSILAQDFCGGERRDVFLLNCACLAGKTPPGMPQARSAANR